MIAAVAVLLTHMLSTAVANMKPRIIALGRGPTTDSTANAMRRCRSQRWMASAIKKPPRKRNISGFA